MLIEDLHAHAAVIGHEEVSLGSRGEERPHVIGALATAREMGLGHTKY